jgi:hypothetical protein
MEEKWLDLDSLVWPKPYKLPSDVNLIIDTSERMPRIIVEVDEGAMTPELSRLVALEIVNKAVNSNELIYNMIEAFMIEAKANEDINAKVWFKFCNKVIGDSLAKIFMVPREDLELEERAVEFYQDILKEKVINGFISIIGLFNARRIFEDYPPSEHPLVFCAFNPTLKYEIPGVSLVNSLRRMQIHKMAPLDAHRINPFPKSKFVAYGMFYSYYFGFNIFAAIYTSDNFKTYQYYYVIYHRLKESILRLRSVVHKIIVCDHYEIKLWDSLPNGENNGGLLHQLKG